MSGISRLFVFVGFFAWLFYGSSVVLMHDRQKHLRSDHMGLGILVLLVFSMMVGSIKLALIIQVSLAIAGSILVFRTSVFGHRFGRIVAGVLRTPFIPLVIVGTAFAVLVVQDAIVHWDARSIWFYHAKVIFHINDIWANGVWQEHAHEFSQVNYPKLFPLLAAQSAHYFGLWNEHVPKLGLSLLLLPIVLFAIEYARTQSGWACKSIQFLTMILTLFFFDGAGFYLTSGYMDGWLAMYAFCLLLMAVAIAKEIQASGSSPRWRSFFVFGAILSQIKQEGLAAFLLILAVTLSVIGFILLKRNTFRDIAAQAKQLNGQKAVVHLPVFMAVILPVALWEAGMRIQGIASIHYSGNVLARMTEKWNTPGVPSWIFSNMLFHNPMMPAALLLSIVLLLALASLKVKMGICDLIPLFCGVLYACVLFGVYLASSSDVVWHLGCSAGRTTLGAAMMLMAFNFNLLFLTLRPVLDEPGVTL